MEPSLSDTGGMELNKSMLSPNANNQSNGMMAIRGERSVEKLSYRSMSFDLNLSDNRGRSVSVSFSSEQLDYSRTYDRFAAVTGVNSSSDPMDSLFDQVKRIASNNIAEQGMALIERQQEKLSYQSQSLTIEGDVSLLKDYFSSTNTADRIMNFVDRMGAGVDTANDQGFGNFMSEITRGINEGIAQAAYMLGGLPDVSVETQSLLQLMLGAYQQNPGNVPQAVDFLEQVRAGADTSSEELIA